MEPLSSPADGFALRREFRVKIKRIGLSGEPVIVVDGVMQDPGALIEHAANGLKFLRADGSQGGYPGVRAPAPHGYAERLLKAVDPLIRATFGLRKAAPKKIDSSFSMVTRPPKALHVMQRIPHIDTSDPLRFALLHYLCGPPFGGTAFFRQQSTGIEQVSPTDLQQFRAARQRDIARLAPSSGYPDADTPGYAQTARFAAQMDRLLIYRSFSLHSGIIPSAPSPLADPRSGRLTLNSFADYSAAEQKES